MSKFSMPATVSPLPSSPTEAIDVLKAEMYSPLWEARLLDLMKLAEKSDKNTWALIYQLVREADSGRLTWGYHKPILSGLVYLLSYLGDSKSYRILVNYIKSLDRPIPIGALELISDLLPTFPELDVKEIFEIAKNSNELKSAFGVMALCKFTFENRLNDSEKDALKEFLSTYKNYSYYLTDLIESTLEYLAEGDKSPEHLLNDLNELF
ncbi:hypothetical protein LPTSP4_30240 [Leptospira ryugenii]|uniref:Uncharacterized protein n=1 Tax=Leptospira ryugenii TaxID=1917863 RepID=A0A2P2E3T4_9LEPT|nr:hypothetical protein [Leptospira ryugenii]GBF51486.1 hypothetical protein LPTSP4_30240 [Leptospira ryugenii]